MKHGLLVLLFLSLLFGCTEVYFTEPQPLGTKALNEIPPEMQGRFIEPEGKDTVHVRTRGFDIGDDFMNLSDSMVVKYWKGFYFINMRDSKNGLWEVYAASKSAADKITVSFIDGEDEKRMKQLGEICTVVSQTDSDGEIDYYILNPSAKEFKAILKENFFDQTIEYTKILQ
jgi:hypothetical protein